MARVGELNIWVQGSRGYLLFGSLCPNLRSLFNRFTQTIFVNKKNNNITNYCNKKAKQWV